MDVEWRRRVMQSMRCGVRCASPENTVVMSFYFLAASVEGPTGRNGVGMTTHLHTDTLACPLICSHASARVPVQYSGENQRASESANG